MTFFLREGPSAQEWMRCWLTDGPKSVQLLVLVDRRFQRELPIEPQYVGKTIDSIDCEYVQVTQEEGSDQCRVMLLNEKPE